MVHASAIAESIVAPTLFRPEFLHSLDPKRTFPGLLDSKGECTENQWFPYPFNSACDSYDCTAPRMAKKFKKILLTGNFSSPPASIGVRPAGNDPPYKGSNGGSDEVHGHTPGKPESHPSSQYAPARCLHGDSRREFPAEVVAGNRKTLCWR